jgi:bifunctional pyridoxal-dependent enzyme with beta-cystathionase and maltose regulon repressor activities
MLDKKLDWWRRDIIKHLTKIRDLCVKRMNKIPGVSFPKIEGTYMPFPRFDYKHSSKELNEYLLKEAKVALSVGTGFGTLGEKHQRVCIATSEAIMNEAIDRMDTALRKLK